MKGREDIVVSTQTTIGTDGGEPPIESIIPLYKPYLGPEVHQAASAALNDGWLAMGPWTKRFEDELATYLGLPPSRPLVATSSCTSALHLAFELIGAGPGDEVICPSFTYVAGLQAIAMTGANPVFCDIEETTLGLDPASIRRAITPRTKAIMVVHFAGIPCDIRGVYQVAQEHGLRVIEDAAHAFGTTYEGRPIGSFGDLVAFSFGPVKIITSLEGGALISPNAADREVLQQMRLLGVTSDTAARYAAGRAWDYDVVRQGFRYHLGSIPSAIGCSQLAMIDSFIENRRRYSQHYNEAFGDLPGLIIPSSDYAEVAPYIYVVRVAEPSRRKAFMDHLKQRGVITGIHFTAAHHYTRYLDSPRQPLPTTDLVASQVVSLPLHAFMDESVLDRVVEGVTSFFR